jgi:hypothetical protein
MGFLNKAFRKVKKQIQPGQMPRRGGGLWKSRQMLFAKTNNAAAIWV